MALTNWNNMGTAFRCTGGARSGPVRDLRASLTGQGHALLIGVSKYDNDAWPERSGVTTDLDDLAKGLAPHFATVETRPR